MVQYTMGQLPDAKFSPNSEKRVDTGAPKLEHLVKIAVFQQFFAVDHVFHTNCHLTVSVRVSQNL